MSLSRTASSAFSDAGSVVEARARRSSRLAAAFALAAAFVALSTGARAQLTGGRAPTGGPGGEHEIYGEFKVDESKTHEKVPGSFVLILTTDTGKVVERQSAMINATFRFFGLRSGNYEIVVESAGMPVARVPIQLISSRKIELHQDITLEWVNEGPAKSGPKPAAVSAADYYERNPANRDLFEKASVALKKKKYEEAVALLQQVVAADDKDHVAWAALGSAYGGQHNAAESERCYRRALELKPEMLAAAVNLGRQYAAAKQFDKAYEVLRPAVEKHPESADAHFLLAEACLQTRRYDEAANEFTEALRLDPKGKADAHLRLALLLDASGKKDKAAAELEQFLAKRPEYPDREKLEQYIQANKKH